MRSPSLSRLAALASLLALAACEPRNEAPPPMQPPPQPMLPPPMPAAPQLPPEAPPTGRLPTDARPTHYRLSLSITPSQPRFFGQAEIDVTLDRPRDVIWIHGKNLSPKHVSVAAQGSAPIPARWEQVTPAGLVAVRLASPIGPGNVVVHVAYDAPFGEHDDALSHVTRDGKAYAFTQFESIFARQAFPCFDEPSFKTPYDVTLFVPQGQEGISNAHEIERAPAPNGMTKITFATTEKIPSYLVAFAVGPFDIVSAPPIPPNSARKRPLPLRGIAVAGRGKEFGYSLAHTPEIVAALEEYFGIEYPYDKLDLIAVPEKGGAMENPGAVTFGESLLLMDEKTGPESQREAFASVTAHELAHQWFGDLVTTAWWDDIWLNEAFATWMARRTMRKLYPKQQADMWGTEATHGAMGTDTLMSARQIRQEIKDENDILNAFDGITYQKGSAVLGMFERWVGPEVFRKGVAAYLTQHRFGNATEADLLQSVSAAAGRDVITPFRSFLFQPGVPLVEASVDCTAKPVLKLKQSRFLPIGSTGDTRRMWQVPVCARYPDGKNVKESCTLLAAPEGSLPLETATCPAWVMPNADAAGYYRWTLPGADLKKLATAGYAKLTIPERMSFAASLRVGFSKGTTPASEVLASLTPFAADHNNFVARAPMDLLSPIRQWLADDATLRKNVEAYDQRLYGSVAEDVGWEPKKGKPEDADRPLLRETTLEFLAMDGKDPKVRKEAIARAKAFMGLGKDNAIHIDAVNPDLAHIALRVLGDEGDPAAFDAAKALLATTRSEPIRRDLLDLIASANKPELAAKAREMILDPKLELFEAINILRVQISRPETRDGAWEWLKGHLDPVIARFAPPYAAGIASVGYSFCDQRLADDFQRVFATRMATLDGGPRRYANVLEGINLCIARRKAQEPSAREFFGGKKAASGAPKSGAPKKAK